MLFLSACTSASVPADTTARDTAIYRVVILDAVDRSGVEFDQSTEVPPLFIEALGAEGIALEVQIEVVSAFVELFEVRFIDRRDEAIEVDLPGLPVRSGSLLIGLGPIVVDEVTDVRVELYVDQEEIRGYGYTMVADGKGEWTTAGSPTPIEPEGLVSAP
jgi:hypothetical protein